MLNVLSLFAGIGGLELGLERAGMNVVGQVELNPFCRNVLARHWPDVPRHDDVRTAIQWWESETRPNVDLICGGFPCTDISNAGGKLGITGPQSGLWGAMFDMVRHLRPQFVLVENVAALTIRGLDTVLADLASIGFDAQWSTVSACSMGAPHSRERLFVLAYPESFGWERRWSSEQGPTLLEPEGRDPESRRPWSSIARPVGVAYGLSQRVDRLTALGNAVVPQVAEFVGRHLLRVA
jgi:DNA (cytosine-5)-methyltransferase 1